MYGVFPGFSYGFPHGLGVPPWRAGKPQDRRCPKSRPNDPVMTSDDHDFFQAWRSFAKPRALRRPKVTLVPLILTGFFAWQDQEI